MRLLNINVKIFIVLSLVTLFLFGEIVTAVTPIKSEVEWIHNRRFLWQKPSESPPAGGYPVLFVLHGSSCFAESWFWAGRGLYKGAFIWGKEQTKFVEKALERGYFVIAPDSTYLSFLSKKVKAWDASTTTFNESIDLPFIQDILDWLVDYPPTLVNTSRLYCAGFSSGGFMTSRIAHFFGSRFKAVAIHSATNADVVNWRTDFTSPQNFSHDHPPTLIIQGGKDWMMPAKAAIHFYEELQKNGIPSKLLYKPNGHHIWYSEFDNQILDWFDSYGNTSVENNHGMGNLPLCMSYNGTILYVGGSGPNNYTKIQDALDNATTSDTVFVYDDSSPYKENIFIQKSVNLIGENENSTVIDGGENGDVINITADNVFLSRFTIQNCGKTWPYAEIHIYGNKSTITNNLITHTNPLLNNTLYIYTGIFLYKSSQDLITNNIISNHYIGILCYSSTNSLLSDNMIKNSTSGIYLQRSNSNNTVSNNEIINNIEEGIYSHQSSFNVITGNTVLNNGVIGIDLYASHGNNISMNMIDNHDKAISCLISDNNSIYRNTLSNSSLGIDVRESVNNYIMKNNFIKNKINAISRTQVIPDFLNTWDSNYWERPRVLPKLIFSIIRKNSIPFSVPWLFFDWHPAKELYDIPTGV